MSLVWFVTGRHSRIGADDPRGFCNDSGYAVFLTVPKSVKVTDITLAEVRFDKREPVGLTVKRVENDLLVAAIGDAKDEANFVFMTDDLDKGVRGAFSGTETMRVGMTVVTAIRSSSQMIYRLSLAKAAATGTEATFNLAGFTKASADLKECRAE